MGRRHHYHNHLSKAEKLLSLCEQIYLLRKPFYWRSNLRLEPHEFAEPALHHLREGQQPQRVPRGRRVEHHRTEVHALY